MARDLAGKSFKAPDNKLPDNLKDLDYDRYRAIRFLPERSLWRGEKLSFEAQFFHRGFFYTNRVDIYEVKGRPGDENCLSTGEFLVRRHADDQAGRRSGFRGLPASRRAQQARLL
jgi:glucans biosynthesis protein